MVLDSSIVCDNAAFGGDPIRGVVKSCEILEVEGVEEDVEQISFDEQIVANGRQLYAEQCAGCHGDHGERPPKLDGVCLKVDCSDIDALSDYLSETMPYGNPGVCTGSCSSSIATFIVAEIQSIKYLESGSWNVDPATCGEALPGASQRILPKQIGNILFDVFNDESITDIAEFPAPRDGGAFSTDVSANRVSKNDIADLLDAAESVGLSLIGRYSELAGCPTGITESCALTYIEELAEKLYRGIYSESELDLIVGLYHELSSGADPLSAEESLAGTVVAMLQSPAFLYLLEIGTADGSGDRILTSQEIANRIAFLLTDTLPDDVLLNAAKNESWGDSGDRLAQAERLLSRSAATESISNFFGEWLGSEDSSVIQDMSDELRESMHGEFNRIVQQIIDTDSSITSLFSRNKTFVNQLLADGYGLSSSFTGDEWLEVNREASVLGSLFVATSHSHSGFTSIIKRGRFVRESLLCQELGTPPVDALAQNPVLSEDATVRDYMDARGDIDMCSGCHAQMDSIGIGMEDFDQLGQSRDFYDLTGHEVDSSGVIVGFVTDIEKNTKESVDFNGTSELGAILASSPSVLMCAKEQWFTYAMGRSELAQCHAASVGTDTASPRALVLDLVASDKFVLRSDRAYTKPMQLSEEK